MPALARPTTRGINPAIFQPINPSSYFSKDIPEIVPDTTKASEMEGKAAIAMAVSKALQELPDTVVKGIRSGRRIREEGEAHKQKMGASKGKLAGVRYGQDNSIVYEPQTPKEAELQDLIIKGKRQDIENNELMPNPIFGDSGAVSGVMAPAGNGAAAPGELREEFVNFIKGVEGKNNTAYKDGIQTSIGYGSVGKPGEKIDDAEADRRLRTELREHAGYVDKMLEKHGKNLTPAQRETLISVSYNAGPDDAEKLLLEKDPAAALNAGFKTTSAGPQYQKGLENRRKKEAAWWLSGSQAQAAPAATGNADNLPPVPANAAASLAGVTPPASSMPSKLPAGSKQILDTGSSKIYEAPGVGRFEVPKVVKKGEPFLKLVKGGADFDADDAMIFNSFDELKKYADDRELDVPNVIPLPDGKFKADKFVPRGDDSKGKNKLTDSQKNALMNSANLASDINDLSAQQAKLYDSNKAGPIMGRIHGAISSIGWGDKEYVETAAQLDVGKFKIARLLNGPGVLTEKDIQRAQAVAPSLNETKESFNAKLSNVKRLLGESVQNWLSVNQASANPDVVKLAERTLSDLGFPVQKSQTPGAPAASAAQPQKSKMQIALDDYNAGKYNSNPAMKSAIEERLRKAGLLK